MSKKHFNIKTYKIVDADRRRTINIDGNKILSHFIVQASSDPLSTRMEAPDIKHLKWLSDCNTILDIGAGCGTAVHYFNTAGKKAVGVTCNSYEAVIAKEEFGIDLYLSDMHDLPFKDEEFEGIMIWDCLEHSVAPYIAIHEAHRVLKMGGKLLLYMPGEDWIKCSYHYSILSPKQVGFLLHRLGFEISTESIINPQTGEGVYKAIKVPFDKKEFDKQYYK